MVSKTLADLIAGLPDADLVGDPSTPISGVQYDSRKVAPGDLFVALAGGYFDGHNFIDAALERGAAAVLAERANPSSAPQVVVANTRASLAVVAAAFFDHPSAELPVIGVTGTDGKTTTSHLIEAIFAHAGLRSGMIGTIGVRLGDQSLDAESRQTTPESLDMQRHLRAMADGGADVAIVEATSHGLDLHRLDSTRFQIGAVTSITHEHLEHHKTVAAYRRAKAKLFKSVTVAHGHSVINLDDEGAREMLAFVRQENVTTYSAQGQSADLSASNMVLGVAGSTFDLTVGGRVCPVATPLVGGFNVANALCAIGVARAFGVEITRSIEALASVPAVPGRMHAVDCGQPFSVVVDYAHTPDSIEKVLSLLKQLNPGGKLIIVMGSAGERDREKRPQQGAVAARLADMSMFTTEDPRFEDADAIIADIAHGARQAGAVESRDFVCITDRRRAIETALALATAGDCVLLAGKGHEQSIIWGHEKRPWDEATVAQETLAALGYQGNRS